MIYAVITDELGLFGAAAVLLAYLLFISRGFKTAMLARDSFSTLLATGLTCGVRAAGVRDRRRRHARDPADRRHAAVHLLRRLVDRGQLRAAGAAAAGLRSSAEAGSVNAPIAKLFGVVVVLFALLIGVDVALDGVRCILVDAQSAQPPHAGRRAADQARAHRRRRRNGAGPVSACPGAAPGSGRIPPGRCSPRRSGT